MSSAPAPPAEVIVVDASAVIETLLGTARGLAVRRRLRGGELNAPAHLDAEVLSALSRLHRAGVIDAPSVDTALSELAGAPIRRHPLAPLLMGAWAAREQLRLVDALYVELAGVLDCVLLTTDGRLARQCRRAEVLGGTPDA